MDNLKRYDDETIERFVLGQMPDEELDVFLAYQTLHPEMQGEIEAARERIRAVRGTLQQPKNKPSRSRAFLVLAALVLAGIVGLFFWLRETPLAPPVPAAPEIKASSPPAVQQQPIAQAPGNQKIGQPKTLASAYRPNKYLEMQISSGLRGTGFQFKISTPLPGQVIPLQTGQIRFQLSGTLDKATTEADRAFRVLIFDNQNENLEAQRYEAAYPIRFSTDGKASGPFNLEEKPKLKPGLFYYVIEDDKGDWHAVGSFRVE